ncbi:MAG: hypothetical protein LBJ99_03470 [Oscillospiraceae bacterium]|jgi:hypothetical protein|nr:hypothetical protein [Oscillospiraceae bacterium]
MDYEELRLIFRVSAVMAGVSAAVTAVLFLKLRVSEAFGIVTGSAARRAVAEMRRGGGETGGKTGGGYDKRDPGGGTAVFEVEEDITYIHADGDVPRSGAASPQS